MGAVVLGSDVGRAAPTFTVNSNLDAVDAHPGDGLCATLSGKCTLRAAIMEANHTPGGGATITLPAELSIECCYQLAIPASGSDDETSGNLNITADVSIVGKTSLTRKLIVIDGRGSVIHDGVFEIDAGNVTISGVTIENGNSPDAGGGITNLGHGLVTLDHVTVTANAAGSSGGGLADVSGTLTVTNSTISSNTAPYGSGGGILSETSTLTLINSTVSGNSADEAGGIRNDGGMATLSGTTVSGNSDTFSVAGGIANTNGGTMTLTNSIVSGNTGNTDSGTSPDGAGGLANTGQSTMSLIGSVVTGNAGVTGGGILSVNNLTLSNSTVSDNSAILGGGLYTTGLATVTNSSVSGNSAVQGGGIYNESGSVTITRSTINNNQAGGGLEPAIDEAGGIYDLAANLTLVNSTISGNSAVDNGGGISNYAGLASLFNDTITNNYADSDKDLGGTGGGVFEHQYGTLQFQNSVIGGNFETHPQCHGQLCGVAVIPGDCSGGIGSQGHSIIGYANPSYCTVSGQYLLADAQLGPLQDNGGPTQTHALLGGSPAIDGGDPAGCKDGSGALLLTDQRGSPRPLDGDGDGNSVCDIGAFEHDTVATPTPGPTVTPTSSSTPTPSTSATPVGSATPTMTPTLTPAPTPTIVHSPTPTAAAVRGDANCDGDVDVDDVTAVLSQLAAVPPGAPCADRADMNCNGHLDADDALRILANDAGDPLPQPNNCPGFG